MATRINKTTTTQTASKEATKKVSKPAQVAPERGGEYTYCVPRGETGGETVLFRYREDRPAWYARAWTHPESLTVEEARVLARFVLSNFFVLRAPVKFDGRKFYTTEAAYQYAKYMVVDPVYAREVIEPLGAAGIAGVDAKLASGKGKYLEWARARYANLTQAELGRRFDEAKRRWDNEHSVGVMYNLLDQKFEAEPLYARILVLLDAYNLCPREQGRMKRDYWCHTGRDTLGRMHRAIILHRRQQQQQQQQH